MDRRNTLTSPFPSPATTLVWLSYKLFGAGTVSDTVHVPPMQDSSEPRPLRICQIIADKWTQTLETFFFEELSLWSSFSVSHRNVHRLSEPHIT